VDAWLGFSCKRNSVRNGCDANGPRNNCAARPSFVNGGNAT
jgi:hypothetical protein